MILVTIFVTTMITPKVWAQEEEFIDYKCSSIEDSTFWYENKGNITFTLFLYIFSDQLLAVEEDSTAIIKYSNGAISFVSIEEKGEFVSLFRFEDSKQELIFIKCKFSSPYYGGDILKLFLSADRKNNKDFEIKMYPIPVFGSNEWKEEEIIVELKKYKIFSLIDSYD